MVRDVIMRKTRIITHLRCIRMKPTFSICKNKGPDYLRWCTVSLQPVIAFVFSTKIVLIFLYPKFQISSHLCSSRDWLMLHEPIQRGGGAGGPYHPSISQGMLFAMAKLCLTHPGMGVSMANLCWTTLENLDPRTF